MPVYQTLYCRRCGRAIRSVSGFVQQSMQGHERACARKAKEQLEKERKD